MAGTCQINNSNQNSFAFPLTWQEWIYKLNFVWVCKLENNAHFMVSLINYELADSEHIVHQR